MEILYLPSSNLQNKELVPLLSKFTTTSADQLPDTPICKFTFDITLKKVLTPDTDTLLLKNESSIVGLIQIKMIDDAIFISNFCSVVKGAGSILLNKVIEISKQLKKDIALTYDEFGENPKSLVKYYETYGFVNTSGNNMILKSKGGTRKSIR
jgi:hypothetical protein